MSKDKAEQRYRRAPSTSGASRESSQGEQRQRYRRADYKKQAAKKQMTYDDYVRSIQDVDKIIDIENDSRRERIAAVVDDIKSRSKSAYLKASPVASKGVKYVGRALKRVKVPKQLLDIQKKTALGLTSLLVLVISGYFLFGNSSSDDGSGEVQSAVVTNNREVVQPDFEPLTPDDLDESQALNYDPSVGVASFRDIVVGNVITVSQQPLTDEQLNTIDVTLGEIAVSVLAPIKVETNKGPVYITEPTGEGDPSQTAIFSVNGLLIFARTQGVSINTEAWVEYINSL